MNQIFSGLLIVLLTGFTGCRQPTTQTVVSVPSPTPDPGYAGSASTIAAPTVAAPAAATVAVAEEVSTPEKINIDADDAGNRAVRAEVLKRIDVMPNLGDSEKDKLYVQVERARGMGKVITIPFASGEKAISSGSSASLCKAVKLPEIAKYSEDPTVVFVVLGYADKKGDPKSNLAISTQRAEAVVKVLKDKAGVANIVHAVGMGGSEMFDSASLDKNRVVEVWAVLP